MPRLAAAVGASPSAVVRKTGRPSPSSAARARVSGSRRPSTAAPSDARGLERPNLGARHGMQAAGDDEPGASPGHRRGRPRMAQMSGGELREPAEPARISVRRRDAGGGERVEVGLRLRVGCDDAARGAPERCPQGRAPHRAHSRATGGARAARRPGAGCPSRPRCRRDRRGRARSPRCGRGAHPRGARRR